MLKPFTITAMVITIIGTAAITATASLIIPIPVQNPSFETPALSDGDFTDPDLPNSIPSWTNRVGVGRGGVVDPVASSFNQTGNILDGPGDGENVVYITSSSGSVGQTLTGITLMPGFTYTLTVAIGNDAAFSDRGFKIALNAGATELTSFSGDASTYAPAGGFSNAVASYQAPLVGTPTGDLAIYLSGVGDGVQLRLDNVQLTALIPEPSVILLLASGAAVCWRMRKPAAAP